MGFSLKKLGASIYNGVNVFDQGRGWSSEKTNTQKAADSLRNAQQQARQTPAKYGPLRNPQVRQQFLAQRPASGGEFKAGIRAGTNYVKSIPEGIVNTAQIPYSMARVWGNQIAGNDLQKQNAQKAFQSDLNNSMFSNVGKLAQMGASALASPYSNHLATNADEYAKRTLTPGYEQMYQAYGFKPGVGKLQAEYEAGLAKQSIQNDPFNRTGIKMNDSIGTLSRKVGASAGGALMDIATAGSGMSGGSTIGGKIGAGMAFGGLSGLASTAQMDDPTKADYFKNITKGAAMGGALPVAFHVGGNLIHGRISDAKASVNIKTKSKKNDSAELYNAKQNLKTVEQLAKRENSTPVLKQLAKRRVELKKQISKLNQKGGSSLNNNPTIHNIFGEDVPNPSYKPESLLDQGGVRQGNDVQTQIETAHNLGDNAKVAELINGIQDPNLKAGMEATFGKQDVASTVKGIREGKFNPDKYTAEIKANREAALKGSPVSKLKELRQNFDTKMIDTLTSIEKPVTDIIGRKQALPLRNALDRSLRSSTIGGKFVEDHGLANIIKSVDKPDVFQEYLTAKHAQSLEANGIKTGRNLIKDQQLINAVGDKYQAHAQAVSQYSHTLLDQSVAYGLISKETATMLKAKYPDYVPFDRVFSDAEKQGFRGNGSGPASLSSQTVVQKIKGSERAIQPPLESLLAKTHDLVNQGERNMAAIEVAKTSRIPGNPLQITPIADGVPVPKGMDTISYLENGVKKRFLTTPEVAIAAKSLDRQQLGFVSRVIAQPATRTLRLGATGANIAFAAANVAKDAVSAFVNSEHPLRSSIANPKVFLESLSAALHHGGKQYSELVREGAGGTSFDIARPEASQTFATIRSHGNPIKHAFRTVTNPGEFLRAIEDGIGRSEEFGRAMQYFGNKEAALAEGKSLSYAKAYGADAARNNTVNFSRAGSVGRTLNSYIPYLNPGVQGSRTLLRNLKERPTQTVTKIALTTLLPMAAATSWNTSDPERKRVYDNIPEFEKQNNIIIIPPNAKQDEKTGRWNVIKIPMSQETANSANVVRNGIEDGSVDPKKLAGNMFGSATSINAQNPTQAVGQFTPQIAKPVVETALNKNLYTGQQIVPDSIKNLDRKDQVTKNTSGTARVIGKLTNGSPIAIDNAIRTAASGSGQNVLHGTDTLLNKAGVIPKDQIQGKTLESSIKNRFTSAQGQTPGTLYFKSIQDTSKQMKLAGKDYELLNSLTTKEVDPNGNAIPQNDKDALNNNSILANNPRVAAVRAQAAKNLAKQTGKPVDPLYNLSPKQQEAYYKLNSTIYKGQAYERIKKENTDWMPKFQEERTKYFDKLKLKNPEVSGKVKYPLNDSEKSSLNGYFSVTDPVQRGEILKSNPTISQALNKLSKYANDKQIAQGSAPLDTYPQSDPKIEGWTKEYFALPKGTKTKWQKANPGKWAAISQDMTSKALYGLQSEAVAAQYKDTGMSQKGLKDIYNLGQYNIGKTVDSNGNSFFDLAGSNGTSGYGSRGGSSGSGTIALKPGAKTKGTGKLGSKFSSGAPVKLKGMVKYATANGKPKVTIKKSLV